MGHASDQTSIDFIELQKRTLLDANHHSLKRHSPELHRLVQNSQQPTLALRCKLFLFTLKSIVRRGHLLSAILRRAKFVLKLPFQSGKIWAKLKQRFDDTGHLRNLLTSHHLMSLKVKDQQALIDGLRARICDLEQGQRIASRSEVSGAQAALPDDPAFDRMYRQFEDQFRAHDRLTSDVHEQRWSYLDKHLLHLEGKVAVDIGSGRGEWLTFLKNKGLKAEGVEPNAAMASECRKEGFVVHEHDAFSFLLKAPKETYDLLTAFHVIEHLDHKYLFQTLAESFRVMKPGGLILLETPNPENLTVGACNFYSDLTHLKPLPPATVGFLLSFFGYEQLGCWRINGVDLGKESDDPVVQSMRRWFEVGQDYIIVARKPGDT